MRWRRSLLVCLICLAAVALAGIAYLQTRDGFTRVVIPLLDRLLDAELTAAGGRLRLTGTVEARHFRYRDPALGLAIRVTELRGRLSPWALLGGRVVIDELVATRADAAWRHSPAAHLLDLELEDEIEDGSGDRSGWSPPALPFSVVRARVEDLDVRVTRPTGSRILLSSLTLDVSDLLPGGRGHVEVEGAVHLNPGDPSSGHTGTLDLRLDLAQHLDGTLRNGRSAATMVLRPLHDEMAQPGTFHHAVEIQRPDSTRVHTVLHLAADVGGTSLGEITIEGTVTGLDGDSIPTIDVRANLVHLTAAFLNPMLIPLGSGQLDSGALDAAVRVRSEETAGDVAFDGRVVGRGLALRKGTGATRPVEVHGHQAGRWQASAERLRLDDATLEVVRSGATIIDVQLREPLDFDFGTDHSGPVADDAGGTGTLALAARIRELDLPLLGEWLELLGVSPPGFLTRATVDGDLSVRRTGTDAPLRIDGQLGVTDLEVAGPPGRRPRAPLSLVAEVGGTLSPARGTTIERLTARARQGRTLVGTVSLGGAVTWRPRTTDLRGEVDTPDVGAMLRSLDLGSHEALRGFEATPARARWTMVQTGNAATLDVAGTFAVGPFVVQGAGGALRRDLAAEVAVGLGQRGLRVEKLALTARDEQGRQLGSMRAMGWLPYTLQGSWQEGRSRVPGEGRLQHGSADRWSDGAVEGVGAGAGAGAGAGEGRLHVEANGLELAPWFGIAGYDVPPAAGPLPLDVEVDVRADPRGTFEIEGTESLRLAGRSEGGAGGRDGAATTYTVTHEIRGEPGTSAFHVALRSSGRADGRMEVRGVYRGARSPRPLIELTADLGPLDLSPLAVLRSHRSPIDGGRAVREGAPAEPSLSRDRAATDGSGTAPRDPVLDVEATARVDRVRYLDFEVRSAQGTATIGADAWRIVVPQAELLGGTATATLDRRGAGAENRLEVALTTRRLDLAPVFDAFWPTAETRVDGRLDVQVSGSARAPAQAKLLDRLAGTVNATLAHGRLRGANPMAFLARETGVSELARIPIDTMSGRARVRVDSGIAYLEDVELTSTLAGFVITGEVVLGGDLHLRIDTRVGPGLARSMESLNLHWGVFGFVDKLVSLPVAIKVEGRPGALRYAAVPSAAGGVGATKAVVDSVKQIGRGAVSLGQRAMGGGGDPRRPEPGSPGARDAPKESPGITGRAQGLMRKAFGVFGSKPEAEPAAEPGVRREPGRSEDDR